MLRTAGIKNYKLIIRKKKKKHDKMVSLAKTNFNSIEVESIRMLVIMNSF